jgi:hypothetical protein
MPSPASIACRVEVFTAVNVLICLSVLPVSGCLIGGLMVVKVGSASNRSHKLFAKTLQWQRRRRQDEKGSFGVDCHKAIINNYLK